jgi:pyruvate-formate lyase-activating enzyme
MEDMNSLIIHCLEKCNLDCYGCFNKCLNNEQEFYSAKEIIEFVKINGISYDAIIISGGEFLVNDIDEIHEFLFDLREVFDGAITLNSNGTFPDSIDYLFNTALIDGVHLDIKMPYERILNDNIVCSRWAEVIGFKLNDTFKSNMFNVSEKIKRSVESIYENDNGYSSFRTVRYPILEDRDFESIKDSVAFNNKKYNTYIKWSLNDFVDIDM